MITERGEAFKHNSCKKLAQLAKVIFQMTKAKIDRDEEITDTIIKYETSISQIVDQHQKSAEEIARKLVAFRKSCIDRECQEYANQYKVIKTRLINLSKEKLQILQDFAKEGEQLLLNVNNIQKNSINEANKYVEHANQTQEKIRNLIKTSQATIEKKAKKSIQPIIDKISNLQKENDAKMKQILAQHAQDIRNNRTEIYKILHKEILLRKNDFNAYRSNLNTLKNDLNSMKKEYNQIIKDHELLVSDFKNNQNSIASSTSKKCKEIKNLIENLLNKEKNSESERKFQITELNKVKQNLINTHQKDLNNIITQIQYQKHQLEQFETAKTAEIEKQQNQFESTTIALKKDFENTVKNRNETFSEIINSFSECEKDLTLIKSHLQSIIDESTVKANNRKETFQIQIEKENQSIQNTFERQLNNFKDAAKNRITIMTNVLKNQDNLNHELQKQIRKEIHQLLDQLKNLQIQITTEIEEKKKKDEKDKIEYQKANLAREQNRKKEIETAMNRKKNEKEKQFSLSKEKLDNDLKVKKKQLENENKIKLDDYIKNIESILNLDKEENEHKSKLLKMKGKLNFATEQFEISRKNYEQRLSILQNEIQNSEKLMRQIQRKIKTETQAINEEYEMKIQVEQVKLNNAIENISKLYEKDENLRGVEIVEAIRKLRDIKNRSVDLQNKKKHEIENEKKKFQKKKGEIEDEIKNLKDQTKLNELNEHLKKLTENSSQQLKKIEEEKNSKFSILTEKTNQIQNEQEKKLKEIRNKIEIENLEFQTKKDEIKSKEIEIKTTSDNQLKKFQDEFESKQKSLIEKHQDQVSKLKNRIESAKKILSETINNSIKESETATKNENDMIQKKCKDSEDSLSKVSQEFIQKDSQLTSNIKDLLVKVSHLHINQIISPMRKIEEDKLKIKKDELVSKDSDIQYLFNSSLKAIESVKLNSQNCSFQQQQKQPMKFKVGSNNSKIVSTRKVKNEFPKRIETPKKCFPSILTPQLI